MECQVESRSIKDWQNFNETNFPVPLFLYAIKEGNIKPPLLRTYFGLKLYFPDHFILNKVAKQLLTARLKITTKTLNDHLAGLIKHNIAGFDKDKQILYVRTRYAPSLKGSAVSSRNINDDLLSFKVSKEQLNHFTEYLVAAAIAYLIRKQKNFELYKAALKNDGTLQALYKQKNDPVPLPLSYIAKFLNKSISWVDKYKKRAQQLGLIIVSKVDNKSTGIKWEHRRPFLKSIRIPPGRVRKKNNEVYLVAVDLLSSSIYLKKRK